MATANAIMITTPSSSINVPPMFTGRQPTKEKEEESVKLFSSATVCFLVVGICNIIIGAADLVTAIMALICGSVIAISFSGVWSGFVFGIVNGALALRAAKNKPQVNLHWANVTFGFGITTIILAFIDLALALTGTIIYSHYFTFTTSSVNNASNYYIFDPAAAESSRLVMLVMLVSLDIWQVVMAGKLRRYFRNNAPTTATYTFLTINSAQMTAGQQQAQLPMQMQGQMPIQMISPSVPQPLYSTTVDQPNLAPPSYTLASSS